MFVRWLAQKAGFRRTWQHQDGARHTLEGDWMRRVEEEDASRLTPRPTTNAASRGGVLRRTYRQYNE